MCSENMAQNAGKLPKYPCGIVKLVGWSIIALVINYDRRETSGVFELQCVAIATFSTVELFLCVAAYYSLVMVSKELGR